ncbi:hypothetical protein [Paraflavitalea sp. CAU 1676]|uniref:hypothetical protein n=1 Tax=Paraflavitalea sp. CAU 1676 TaxID=3032598 RepID=UPI0023DAAF0A|nr:hypothetical protein [Paraflavitalea sp. CAU 1676]MDF2193483.1 hypothetical protein [Paraflavitalea sp. CAU 1676]
MPNENVQLPREREFSYLDICCQLIEQEAGAKKIADWTNGDYLQLSNALLKKTQVSISHNTLKRIFGKLKTPDRYYPQKATRDALAVFAGYADWDHFTQTYPLAQPEAGNQEAQEAEVIPAAIISGERAETIATKPVKSNAVKWRWPVLVLLMVTSIALGFWLYPKQDSLPLLKPGSVTLVCNNPEGNNPHSAIFKLVTVDKQLEKENFDIDFGDAQRIEPITAGSLLTHYYEMPGRYYALLSYQGVVIDTAVVYLKSPGWTATATIDKDTTRVWPIERPLFHQDKMEVSVEDVLHAGVDTNKTFYVHFSHTTPMDISGDNLELQTSLTTSALRPGVRCSQVIVTLFGEKGKHVIMLIKPNCTRWAILRLSENWQEGKSSDLSRLGYDFSSGGRVKMQVENKNVRFWFNDSLAYRTAYNQAIGQLYGVRLSFSGIGSVNNFSLKDLATNKTFHDQFNGY